MSDIVVICKIPANSRVFKTCREALEHAESYGLSAFSYQTSIDTMYGVQKFSVFYVVYEDDGRTVDVVAEIRPQLTVIEGGKK